MGQFVAVLSQERPKEGMMPLRHTFLPLYWPTSSWKGGASFPIPGQHPRAAPPVPPSLVAALAAPCRSSHGPLHRGTSGKFPCSPLSHPGALVRQSEHLWGSTGCYGTFASLSFSPHTYTHRRMNCCVYIPNKKSNSTKSKRTQVFWKKDRIPFRVISSTFIFVM